MPARSASELPVVAVVAVGGMIGALLRYQVGLTLPTGVGKIPWTTVGINVLGSVALGALVVLVTERRPVHRLVRPFLGTGVLGGFTTFSAFSVETQQLLEAGRTAAGLAYLGMTAIAAVTAAAFGMAVVRRLRHLRPVSGPGTAVLHDGRSEPDHSPYRPPDIDLDTRG